jgi:hypothetical protein
MKSELLPKQIQPLAQPEAFEAYAEDRIILKL